MKFVAVTSNHGDPQPYLTAEAGRTRELAGQGTLETLLLKADWSGAVMVLDAPDPSAARAALETLPLVEAGVSDYDLIEVVPPPDHLPAG